MSDTKNIHEKILAITEEIGAVPKEDKLVNKQYRFVSHQAVTDALRPLLIKHKITAIPTMVEHEKQSNNTIMTVEVTFTNVEDTKDTLTVKSIGYGCDAQDKGPGKAFSYATKNLYLKVFNLATGDEDVERYNVDSEPAKQNDVLAQFKHEQPAIVDELQEMIKNGVITGEQANNIIIDSEYMALTVKGRIAKIKEPKS